MTIIHQNSSAEELKSFQQQLRMIHLKKRDLKKLKGGMKLSLSRRDLKTVDQIKQVVQILEKQHVLKIDLHDNYVNDEMLAVLVSYYTNLDNGSVETLKSSYISVHGSPVDLKLVSPNEELSVDLISNQMSSEAYATDDENTVSGRDVSRRDSGISLSGASPPKYITPSEQFATATADLIELNLSENLLGLESLQSFPRFQKLQKLSLSYNLLGPSVMALEIPAALTKLYLAGNSITSLMLETVVKFCSVLDVLDLSDNYICDEGLEALMEVVSTRTEFTLLDLQGNFLNCDDLDL
jgi:Ran GTPase-activating protein (RanGAP) involved in mRNA processing and transport